MKRILAYLSIAVAAGILSPAVRAQSNGARTSMIVSTDWLAKHLSDPNLVLLQVGDKKEYDAAHLKGAQYIQTSDISTPRGSGLILELPPVDQLKATFEKFGVTDKSRIIVYFSKDWVTPTSRVYFTLDYLGLGDHTSILDGGLPAWIAEKRDVTTEVDSPKMGSFTPHTNPKLVVDAGWVSGNLNKPARRHPTSHRSRGRCRAPVTFPARRAFHSQLSSKMQIINSRARTHCARFSTQRG